MIPRASAPANSSARRRRVAVIVSVTGRFSGPLSAPGTLQVGATAKTVAHAKGPKQYQHRRSGDHPPAGQRESAYHHDAGADMSQLVPGLAAVARHRTMIPRP